MFEVGFQELVLIALLALIVIGPEKLPKLATKLGQWTGRARGMARNLRQQLENEVSYEDLLKQKEAAEESLRTAVEAPMSFHHDVQDAGRQVAETIAEAEVELAAAAADVQPPASPPASAAETPPTAIKETSGPA